MPDISMCANRQCAARGRCYRYLAVPTPGWQAYTNFPGPDRSCRGFAEIEDSDYVLTLEDVDARREHSTETTIGERYG